MSQEPTLDLLDKVKRDAAGLDGDPVVFPIRVEFSDYLGRAHPTSLKVMEAEDVVGKLLCDILGLLDRYTVLLPINVFRGSWQYKDGANRFKARELFCKNARTRKLSVMPLDPGHTYEFIRVVPEYCMDAISRIFEEIEEELKEAHKAFRIAYVKALKEMSSKELAKMLRRGEGKPRTARWHIARSAFRYTVYTARSVRTRVLR